MITGSIAVWVVLISGGKIWALVAATSMQLLWTGGLVFWQFGNFFKQLRGTPDDHESKDESHARSFSWSRDVLPIQWRQALLSAVYHWATQLFTLIVLWFESEEAAGRLGMTMSLTGAIQAMALAWIQTKFALASQHHGTGDREKAGTMWRHMAVVSTTLLCVALIAATCIVAALPLCGLGIERRFIAPWQLAILSIGIVANHLVAVEGFYVLSRGSRPLLSAALIGFIATGIAVWAAGYLSGTSGVVAGYALGTACITLPLHTWAYVHYKRSGDNQELLLK